MVARRTRNFVRRLGLITVLLWAVAEASIGCVSTVNSLGFNKRRITSTPSPTPTVQRFAYVGNGGSGTVSVADVGEAQVVATIGVGPMPVQGVFSNDGKRLFVCNANNSVSVIDTGQWRVVATLDGGGCPSTLAPSPDGSWLYVGNSAGTAVPIFVIDTSDGVIVATIPVGIGPVDISFSPNGSRAFAAEPGSCAVTTIDTASRSVIATMAGIYGPHRVRVTPNSRYLVVSDTRENQVWDVVANAHVGTISNNASADVFTADGSFLFLNNSGGYPGRISVVNTTTWIVIQTIIVGTYPADFGISPDGTWAYVSCSGTGTIDSLYIPGLFVANSWTIGGSPTNGALDRTQKKLFVPDSSGNRLVMVDTSTGAVSGSVSVGTGPDFVALWPP